MQYTDIAKFLEFIGSPIAIILLAGALILQTKETASLKASLRELKDEFTKLENAVNNDATGFLRKDLAAEMLRSSNETHERFEKDIRELYDRVRQLERVKT